MTKRMLIDATHREETRVAVVDGNWLVDFDYESKYRKQLKGNIYLAKVTRVEPSLQAAFVNFGGNRHGFLPFNEIHPDYFRLPIADREALLAEQEEEMQAMRDREEAEENADAREDGNSPEDEHADEDRQASGKDDDSDEADAEAESDSDSGSSDAGAGAEENAEAEVGEDGEQLADKSKKGGKKGWRSADNRNVATVGGDDVESDRPPRPSIRRDYKIQEVIKRGQIMLVQVQKEERGNKGAAVSSYLSLPGRYCVLMPNSPRSGGVSRKVANVKDRKRMREVLRELSVPEGMSVIMRTAGLSRNKSEIKRDLDYLMRLWDSIRDLTLKSTAPTLVYEEGNLIKRAIRDLYKRDIEDIQVAGDEGYKEAKNFIKMLVPSHARRVKHYRDEKIPLFHRYQVESQISEMGNSQVTLQSGGSLVIHPTEALVSVDVNSGKATKERHIEETALKTNLEAADEVARQLRLRDLGGLVVVDFIDMDDRRNNAKVEKRLRDALSHDRARIQVGKISNFGLLELSRQRMNPSLTEAQFQACAHCQGTGHVRTTDSAAILALRALEEEGINERADQVILHLPNDIALYILNNKRDMLIEIEQRYSFRVSIRVNADLAPAGHAIEPVKHREGQEGEQADDVVDGSAIDLTDHDAEPAGPQQRKGSKPADKSKTDKSKTDKAKSEATQDKQSTSPDSEQDEKNRAAGRRRGRRGGRRRNRRNDQRGEQQDAQKDANLNDSETSQVIEADETAANPDTDHSEADKETGKTASTANSRKQANKSANSSKSRLKSQAKSQAKNQSGSTKSDNGTKSPAGQGETGEESLAKADEAADKAEETAVNPKAEQQTQAVPSGAQENESTTDAAPQNTGEPDSQPSNDDAHNQDSTAVAESASTQTKRKKKGWWSRLIES